MEETFTAHSARGKTLLLLLGCGVFVAFAIFMLLHPERFPEFARLPFGIPVPVAWFAWAAVLFFSLAAIAWVRRLFHRGPVLEIDARGIHWLHWSEDWIPWDGIARAQLWTVNRQRFLSLWLHDPAAYRRAGLAAKIAAATGAMGMGHVSLVTGGTDRSFDELVAAFTHFAPPELLSDG